MIYKTLTKQEFINEFGTYDEGYANNFSYDGLSTLYDYFDNFEYIDQPSLELDVIAICCEFTEYENLEEMLSDYPDDYASLEDIENATLVLPTESGGFVIQQF